MAVELAADMLGAFAGMGQMNPIPVLDSAVTADRLELAASGSWTARSYFTCEALGRDPQSVTSVLR
jgi:hypothetical protein